MTSSEDFSKPELPSKIVDSVNRFKARAISNIFNDQPPGAGASRPRLKPKWPQTGLKTSRRNCGKISTSENASGCETRISKLLTRNCFGSLKNQFPLRSASASSDESSLSSASSDPRRFAGPVGDWPNDISPTRLFSPTDRLLKDRRRRELISSRATFFRRCVVVACVAFCNVAVVVVDAKANNDYKGRDGNYTDNDKGTNLISGKSMPQATALINLGKFTFEGKSHPPFNELSSQGNFHQQ